MDTNDVLKSIRIALYEEERKAFIRRENFDKNSIVIMATRNAIEHIQFGMGAVWYAKDSDEMRLFGYELKAIDGDDFEIYIAKRITIIAFSKMEEKE